ncbi:MAG: hypothetical protein ACOZE5_16120 [Verrucomicrobiota bacterium]
MRTLKEITEAISRLSDTELAELRAWLFEREDQLKMSKRRLGWHVLRIWEHELANHHRSRLLKRLRSRGLVSRRVNSALRGPG